MKKEQLRVLGKLARAFEACADKEHGSFENEGGGPNVALPLSARALAHYRAMQAFQWCLEAVEEEIEELKEGVTAQGQLVRLGTYGDPAAVPAKVWRDLVKHVMGGAE